MSVVFSDNFNSGSLTGWGSPNSLGTVNLWGYGGTYCAGCNEPNLQSRKTLASPVTPGGVIRAQVACIIGTATDPTDGAYLFTAQNAAGGANEYQTVVYLSIDGSFRIRRKDTFPVTIFANTAPGLFPVDGTQFGLQIIFVVGATNTVEFIVNNVSVATLSWSYSYDANQWDDVWISGWALPTTGSRPPYTDLVLVDNFEVDDDPSAISWPAGNAPQIDLSRTCLSAPLPGVPVAPPLAAQQPCAPQALVGNGGKGAAGCNVGGIGGGQEYSGALGDVPQHTDPPAGELLTGKEGQGIEAWIELVHTDYPSGVKTTYRRALEELADAPTYEGGRKPAGVLAIGDVENALGHEQGGFEAATADIALSDIRDRLIRELAEDQELEGDEVYVKLGSDPGRAALVAPRVLFRGIVQKPELASGLHARLTVVDALFSDFGPFGPDRKDPNWTFGDLGSSAPQMTSDTKAQVIPRLYGEKSDEGAVDPLTGLPASKGLMPGFYLGRFDLTGLVAQAPPSSGQSLASVVAQLQASHTAGTVVADWGSIIGAGDAANLQAMGSVPTSYTSLAQVIGYGDLDVLLSMGTTAAPPPTDWGFIATGLGPWYAHTGQYGSDLGNGSATMQHDRVKLDPLNRADLLVPGVNWPFANPYFEFINDDGRVFWLTGVFVMGPLLQDHLDGVVTMAFNGNGTEDVGDGSGLPIMRAEDCKQHWLENHCFDQWSSGPYTTTGTFPQWEDGTPKVNSTTFTTRQTFFKNQLGGEGLLFSWYTDTQQPTLETVRQLNASSESRLGVNKDGQMVDWGLDETVDYTVWPRINHVTDVFDQVQRTSGEERQNVVNGSCDWDADFEKFRLGPFSFQSAMGLAKYKGRRKAGDPVDSTMLDREAQLLWVLERRLARLQIGTTVLQASGSIGWLDRDVGDGILFTSEDGPGPNGYVDHPFVIVRRKTRLTTMLVQYTLWDVLPVITATLGSPGTP